MSKSGTQDERRARTHERVLHAASRQFRRHGYAGAGVAALAKAAGVTTGALYDHFGSKDAAFAAALEAGLDEVIVGVPRFQAEHGAEWLAAFTDYYLGRPHRDDRETGCAMAALTPEVTRTETDMRARFEAKMHSVAALVADGLDPSLSAETRLARAWAILSALIGAVNLSRAMADQSVADAVAAATRTLVLAIGRGRIENEV